jgi:hypothetical protein
MKIVYTLSASYKGKKYRVLNRYDTFEGATFGMSRYLLYHTVIGDRLKLVASKVETR